MEEIRRDCRNNPLLPYCGAQIFVENSPWVKPGSGWARRYKLSAFVELTLRERTIHLALDACAKQEAELLDGCYCIETDVLASSLSKQEVHSTVH